MLLKIDIQGAEIEVLNHIIDSKQYEKVDKILVETHETKIPEQMEPLRLLKQRIEQLGITNINLNWL